MKMIAIAAVLITLPAIVILLAFFGRPAMFSAAVSLGINLLPFAAMMLLLRGRKGKGDDLSH